MKLSFITLLLLTACAGRPEPVLTPVAVDIPVPVKCRAPAINRPVDLMAALPPDPTLTQFVKACTEQVLFDRGAIGAFEAALKACE